MSPWHVLPRDSNQARGLAEYALGFLWGQGPGPGGAALQQVNRFHLDSMACGVSALALGANAPVVLRREAMEYPVADPRAGACCFGSRRLVAPEKAVLANCSAVREWDGNGTNFGFNPARGHTKGEFGHNDFYPVVMAACQIGGADGRTAVLGMLLLDEIRGRLAEVFSLKDYKIDHVVHGAIASAVTYGALLRASPEAIESALGILIAHYIPFRAIRAGKQLSDSKGASAALSAEAAVVSVRRAMRGFIGPADIFRNPQAIFCLFEKPRRQGESPFDLVLAREEDDFAVAGMHFKLGLYEHQSAGAIQGMIDLLLAHPLLYSRPDGLSRIRITIYEPAFSIIGDPAKRDPRTRQSADHSMVYIIATLVRKAIESRQAGWRELMLVPADYDPASLHHPQTRALIDKIEFVHGGTEYDSKYPDGIPTTVEVEHADLGRVSSGLVMYPLGHARNTSGLLDSILDYKFRNLASLGVEDPEAFRLRFSDLETQTAAEIGSLYDFQIAGCP
jgi:2-methylcitrate dehydratase